MHQAAEKSVLAGHCLKFAHAHREVLMRIDGVLDVDAQIVDGEPKLLLKVDRTKTGPHRIRTYLEQHPVASRDFAKIVNCVHVVEPKPILG